MEKIGSLKNYHGSSTVVSDSNPNQGLTCDLCKSKDIKETREGFVCANCGIVLEIQRFEYHRPYNDDILQHSISMGTKIGNKGERHKYSNSRHLERLNKIHSIKNNKQALHDQARIEISRIFKALKLPKSKEESVFKLFLKLRSKLGKGTKYRAPERLVPIAIFYKLRMDNIFFSEHELLEVSKITKKEFNHFKLSIHSFFPKYAARKKKEHVLQKVMYVTEQFDLGMAFYYQSKKTLYKLWEGIKNTKDDVIAGLVCSITTLCSYQDQVKINKICNALGIVMSTMQSQVQRNLVDRFNIKGFDTLVASADIIKDFATKLGIFESQKTEMNEKSSQEKMSRINPPQKNRVLKDKIKEKRSQIITINSNNAPQVFSSGFEIFDKNINHKSINRSESQTTIFAFKDEDNGMTITTLRLPNSSKHIEKLRNKLNEEEVEEIVLFELGSFHYSNVKDPPVAIS